MVEDQLARRGVRNAKLLAAFRELPRELFVLPSFASHAYEDRALPIREKQTISQPYMIAVMLEALQLRGDERVLEIGAGSGYSAALLSRLVSELHTVERIPELADSARKRLASLGIANVKVVCGDGSLGLTNEAPFDAIVVAAGAHHVPETLIDQLVLGGRLVIPVGEDHEVQMLRRFVRVSETETSEENLGLCSFVPLLGREGWPEGSTGR